MSAPHAGQGPAPARRSSSATGLSRARERLLEHVRAQGTTTVEGAAAVFGQHPNTVRQHLDGLVEVGLLLRSHSPSAGRGRPAWRYRINPNQSEPDPRVREYGALAGALAAHIAAHSPDAPAEARAAGLRWGSELLRDSHDAPGNSASLWEPGAAQQRVLRLLADLDFSPRVDPASRVVLTTCPMLDIARRHPEVVCAVHEGMIAGTLEALGVPSSRVALQPFGAPDGCVLNLS